MGRLKELVEGAVELTAAAALLVIGLIVLYSVFIATGDGRRNLLGWVIIAAGAWAGFALHQSAEGAIRRLPQPWDDGYREASRADRFWFSTLRALPALVGFCIFGVAVWGGLAAAG